MLVRFLNEYGIKTEAIHSDKSQNARQTALNNFKVGKTRILVATDIASRGIDVDDISHVVNFDLPNEPETYVHRIGRTGRAGSTGIAMSFCDSEELFYLADIEQVIEKQIPVVLEHPYPLGCDDNATAPIPMPPKRHGPSGSGGKYPRRGGGNSIQSRQRNRKKQSKNNSQQKSGQA
jgi:ATP-dependent RNA helicase RhlE